MGDAKRRILKVTQQEAAGFDTATNAETDPPGGGTGPEADSRCLRLRCQSVE